MKKAFADFPFDIVSITDFTDEVPEETGTTFEENALIKARKAFHLTGMPSVADDSGLSIDALDGAPGVYAADLATKEDGTRHYPMAFEFLKHQLGEKDKTARFVGVIAYVDEGVEKLFRAETIGAVDFSSYIHVDKETFGYDPIFIPLGDTRTYAEMGAEEKATYSHRSKAINLLKEWLIEHLKRG